MGVGEATGSGGGRHGGRRLLRAAVLGALLSATPAAAFELTEELTLHGIAAGAGQCQATAEPGSAPDICGAGGLFEPTLMFTPFKDTAFSATAGIAAGNALNLRTPFALSPWPADLEDVVTDINGRGRDYLLTAWGRQRFDLGFGRLALYGGLIDATDFVDLNRYANDELNQFMNAAFVNSALLAPPSYDYGAAALLAADALAVRAVYMNVGENDNGLSYNYFATELGYRFDNRLGTAHLRLLVNGTDARFATPSGDLAQLFGVSLSADQAIDDAFGLFARAGWQLDSAAVDYGAEITGGGTVRGALWGRHGDIVGLGAGVLFGGNDGLTSTLVGEAYYRFAVTDRFAITADIQAMRDERPSGALLGAIASLRATASF